MKRPAARYLAVAAVYLAAYLAADEFSAQLAIAHGVSVFYLPPGLTLALLLLGGLRFVPVVLLATLLVGGVTHPLPLSAAQLVPVELSLTACYALAAYVLTRGLQLDLTLSSLRATTRLIVAGAVAAPLLSALVIVSEFERMGLVEPEALWTTIRSFWVGDAIGVLTLTPAIMLAVARLRCGPRPRTVPWSSVLEVAALAAATFAVTWIAFRTDPDEEYRALYLCFVPVAWTALRFGLAGAATASGAVALLAVALSVERASPESVQLFLITLSITALLLGIVASERQHARERARDQAAMLTAVFESTNDAVYVKDREDLRYIALNERAAALIPAPVSELIGRTDFDVFDAATAAALRGADEHVMATGEPTILEEEVPGEHGQGTRVMLSSKAVCRAADGSVLGLIGVSRDITERKAMERALMHLALHDRLTGLANRALLCDRGALALAAARRERRTVAILFCDVDRFKLVNDGFGHAAGDALLQEVANRLSALTRDVDTVARLSGDEFAVLCQDVKDAAFALELAERLRNALREPVLLGTTSVVVTLSIGVVVADAGGNETRDFDALLRDADTAMYRAKPAGDRVVLFDDEVVGRAATRLAVERELRDALGRDELTVFYQPEITFADGALCGFEALVRWRHPERGLLLPGEFIEIAEQTGLILDVGAYVLHSAAEQAARWAHAGADGVTVWINVTARELVDVDFAPRVIEALERHDLPSGALGIELTERMLIERERTVVDTLAALVRHGVQLALDDFGTGYSSLTYLRRFPVSVLKIDREFVSGVAGEHADADDAEITRAVLAMAANLGLTCVAEGVETAEQAEWLRRAGCQVGQGYLFGRPSEAETLAPPWPSVWV
ncbi:MAG TPA: EAL domain-containing protein [Solirubrobacter sp.]|nr:EAL domain-containing protein [Solirubrobacter sp.]